jgi:hypothetical protein
MSEGKARTAVTTNGGTVRPTRAEAITAPRRPEGDEESLLPMHNGATVIRADIRAGVEPGDGRGYVLARTDGPGQYVTWWVWRNAGDPKWYATEGDYHRKLSDAVKSYNLRTGREG